jgi:hypothetical protein
MCTKCGGSLDVSQPYGPPWLVRGIAFTIPFFFLPLNIPTKRYVHTIQLLSILLCDPNIPVNKTSPLDPLLSHFNPSSSLTFLSTNLLQGQPQVLQNIHEAVHLIGRCKVKHPVSTSLMHFPAGKHLHEQKTSGSINYSVTSF